MSIREMVPGDRPHVQAMMLDLWPEAGTYDFTDETVFVWQRPEGHLGAFASVSVRPWAEGCDAAPVPYVEGWYVAPDLRGQGIGRALLAAIEEWCRARGYPELGSDAEIGNMPSRQAHVALGFEPTLQLQFFRKRLV
jgi:aminoglycoside 6'-N-acetyltransferase I